MKKAFVFVLLTSFLILSGCTAPKDEVLFSLGKYKSKEYFTSGGFQDYTVYSKYTYEDVDFSDNKYFEKISSDEKSNLLTHLENFENWVEVIDDNDLSSGYDFDSSIISDDDYLYIYDNPDYPELGCYDVYFFDKEILTLYYFHNNI